MQFDNYSVKRREMNCCFDFIYVKISKLIAKNTFPLVFWDKSVNMSFEIK